MMIEKKEVNPLWVAGFIFAFFGWVFFAFMSFITFSCTAIYATNEKNLEMELNRVFEEARLKPSASEEGFQINVKIGGRK